MTCILRALIAAFCLMLPAAAFGQGAVLQGGPSAPGRAPMYVGHGSQAVVQDSGPASGGAIGLGLAEQLLTVRSPTNTYPAANAGSGQFSTNWCDYDAPITNATGYHFLCFSPNAQGGGLLAYGAGGTASPLPFNLNINGQTYSLGASSGTTFATVAVPTTNGAPVCFSGTTGLLAPCPGITNAQLATVPAATFKGNPTATANVAPTDFTIQGLPARGAPDANNDKIVVLNNSTGAFNYVTPGLIASSATSGVPSLCNLTGALTATQVTACLNLFSSSLQGLVPASGGGTANYLRADGAWVAPPGAGNVNGPGSSVSGHVALFSGTSGTAIQDGGSASTWFDSAYCNTVGYLIVRTTGAWTCSNSIPLDAKWLGATGNGTTDDTTALQNWVNLCQTNKLVCNLSAGTYKTSSALSVTGAITMIGVGPNTSVIAPSNATQDTIDINTNAGFGVLSNFGIMPSVTKTSGASISITAPTLNLFWRIEGMQIGTNNGGDAVSINVLNAGDIYINRNTMSCSSQCIAATGYSKALEDAYITNNFIQPYGAGGAGMNLTDVSGPKITGNKILGLPGASGASGIFWNGDSTCVACSDLYLANNSIEVGGYAVLLESGGSSFSMANIAITGNELYGGAFGNPLQFSGGTYSNVTVTGNNIISGGSGAIGIALSGTGNGFVVANNSINGPTAIGISVASTITASIVSDNKIQNATQIFNAASTSTVIKDSNGMTVAFLPTAAAPGSQIFTTDGTPASSPCTGSSTGSTAFRQNGAWKCF